MIPTEKSQPEQYKMPSQAEYGWSNLTATVVDMSSCISRTTNVEPLIFKPIGNNTMNAPISVIGIHNSSGMVVSIGQNGEVTLGEGITPEFAVNEFWTKMVDYGKVIKAKLARLEELEALHKNAQQPPASEIDDMFAAYERAKKAVQ